MADYKITRQRILELTEGEEEGEDDKEYVLSLLQQLHKGKIRCHEEPLEGIELETTRI